MPREKQYATEAEKQAAYRERKRQQTEQIEEMDGREKAILMGRALGEHEARSRGEVGSARDQRVARASAYAAWEFDGKPWGRSREYAAEFKVRDVEVTPSLARLPFRRLISGDKPERG